MKKYLSLLLLSLSLHAFSQSLPAPWIIAGADTSFPRSIIHSSEIAGVKASLAFGFYDNLFDDVYASAMSTPPAGNQDIASKRTRAQIAKNAAFVLLLDLKRNGGMVPLSVSEKDYLKTTAKTLLENINTYVNPMSLDSPSNFDNWQWTSKEIIDFVTAYDLLRGAGVPATELAPAKLKLKTYVGNLYYEATKISVGASFFEVNKNNHSLMTAGSIGLAAIVLNDITDTFDWLKPVNWINAAMWNIHNVIWWDIKKQSQPGKFAGYAEGSYYFKYAFVNLLPFFRAMGTFLPDTTLAYEFKGISRKIRNPWYDTNYTRIYDWIESIRMPDGRMPAIEDSYTYRAFPELAILRKTKYSWPVYLSQLDAAQDNSLAAQLVSVYDMKANYIAANTPPINFNDSLFRVMPEAGIAVFRSGWDSAATYLALLGKNGSTLSSADAHNQADDGSFLVMVKGQTMAMDPGYLSYEMRDTVSGARAHNMLLVNGAGPLAGRPGKSNGANAYLEKSFSSSVQDYAELRTGYLGASINRKVMFVRKKYFLVADHLSSATPQKYSFLLHGYGQEGGNIATTGTFTDLFANNRAAWQRKNSGLYSITHSDAPTTFSKLTGKHEYAYMTIQNHTYMEVETAPAASTTFLTCLQPFSNLGADTFPVLKLPISSAVAYKVNDGVYADIMVSRSGDGFSAPMLSIPKTVTGAANDYTTDALLFWLSEKIGNVEDLYMYKGHVLKKDADTLVSCANPLNIQYVKTGIASYKGFCGDTGWVKFHCGGYPYGLQSVNVPIMHYDTISKTSLAYFKAAGYFSFVIDDTKIGIREAAANKAHMYVYPNPAADVLHIEFENTIKKGSVVTIQDMTGKVVAQLELTQASMRCEINTGNLSNGVYLVCTTDSRGSRSIPVRVVIGR